MIRGKLLYFCFHKPCFHRRRGLWNRNVFGPLQRLAALFITYGLETIGNANGITIAGFDQDEAEKEQAGEALQDR